jgi:hypothetical protein
MSSHELPGPDNPAADKDEIERMYKCAYYIDRSFFRPADVLDYGIDIVKLKEFGEVVMKKPLANIRPKVKALWDRMSKAQRTMFLYSYFSQGVRYLNGMLDLLEAQLGNCMSERHALSSILTTLNRKFPDELQEKIRDGFGKEWSF